MEYIIEGVYFTVRFYLRGSHLWRRGNREQVREYFVFQRHNTYVQYVRTALVLLEIPI
jgi:hypothetical protein